MTEQEKLALLLPELVEVYRAIKREYEALFPMRSIRLVTTYRSPEEQTALYALGRTTCPLGTQHIKTNISGQRYPSMHNYRPARAFDIEILVDGMPSSDYDVFQPLRRISDKLTVKWGGRWNIPKDFKHFEAIDRPI